MSRGVFLLFASFALLSLSGCRLPGTGCSSDNDCPADQACTLTVCVERCTSSADCRTGACDGGLCVAEVDGGDVHKDAGPDEDAGTDAGPPDEIDVEFLADPTTVDPGGEVTLSWTTAPAADVCTLYVETPFTTRAQVTGAPTSSAADFDVNPDQDSTYTLECEQGELTGSGSVDVNVNASGTLSATPTEVNAGASSELSWETQGATSCEVIGPSSFSYAVPTVDTLSGTTTVSAPVAGDYSLVCDGDTLDSVTLFVASVAIDSVTPDVIGPTPEVVTVSYTYTGPDAGSCDVKADTVSAADESADPGYQVTVSATTTLAVECAGYDSGLVSDDVVVEQLIESFDATANPIDYGAEASVTWTAAQGTECELNDAPATSPHTETLEASADFTLECTKDGKTVSSTVSVSVRPAFFGEEFVGFLTKANSGDPEADVVLQAFTTLNATGCTVSGAGGGPMTLLATEANHLVFELDLPAGTSTGAATYSAQCASDIGVTVDSGEDVRVWWGNLAVASLASFGQASLLTGNFSVADGSNPDLSDLSTLEEVGGFFSLSNTTTTTSLAGLEEVRVVLGALSIENNDALRDLSVGTTEGLFQLAYVGGDVSIDGNTAAGAATANLPALTEVGGGLTITNNSSLTTISMGALQSIGGALTIEGNHGATVPPLTLQVVDMRNLATVGSQGGGFVLKHTRLDALLDVDPNIGYAPFGSLSAVGSGAFGEQFVVQLNASTLTCAESVATYCALDPRPSSRTINEGLTDDACTVSCP